MTLRSLALSAAAIGAIVGTVTAKDPVKPAPAAAAKTTTAPAKAAPAKPVAAKAAPTVSTETSAASNQKLAEAVAARLTASSVTEGADVSIVTDNGTVTIAGTCKNATQKTELLNEIRVVSGVKLVKDGLTVRTANIMQVQGTGAPSSPMPMGSMPMMGAPGMSGGMPPMMGGSYGGPVAEPTPLGMPGGAMGGGEAPPLPPYAWPTYAPHNNVSRVGYPTAYPYNAFPFIGPFYPFPKVPLGWRSVTMTWEDGHWWYGRTSTPQDYWRVRFW